MIVINSGSVEIKKDGKTHEAVFSVRKGVVTVSYLGVEKSTQVGRLANEEVAELLLSEIVNENDFF